jgi:hypothetical protein
MRDIRPPSFLVAATLAVVLLWSTFAAAAPSKWFRQTSARDFEEGEATASMILPTGEVVPGMKATAVGLEAAFVWCSAKSPDGKTAYFGTGDQGKIFAVDVDGHETRARQVAALDVAWVTALTARPDGTLIVGTTPGGRLYTVDPKSGRSSLLATLPADHIWSLARDAKSGALYAGTGAPGKVFSISQKGEARPLWDSGDKHVVSLLLEDEHHLVAGTSESAILFRVGIDGRAEALADFDAEEVRAIAKAPDGAATYVAVNDFDRGGSSSSSGGTGAKGTRITVATSGSPASAGSLPRPGQRKARAALYRIENDGRIEQVFSIGDGYFTSLVFDEQGYAYVGTGTEGRVFRVAPDRTAALAIDLPERQALTLVRAGKGFLIGTGDVGGVYRAEPAPAGKASYLSRVIDGDFRAHWGLLRWQGTHAIAIESRSGNTARPDATWSAFTRLASPHATADGGAGQIASPTARYLQYRVTFDAADARLGGVAVAYLPQNQRARVTEITTGDNASSSSSGSSAGGLLGGLGGSSSSSSSAAARAHSPIVKLRWKIDNPDGDELVYRLAFREENEAVWRPLGGPDPLSKAEYDWNTEGLPDGTYVVRVVASDERAEPRERALDSYLVSPPILVDNRKPEVVGLNAHYPFVSGRARDDQSPISSLEYSVDGGEWQVLSPADGICDDLVEAFTVRLPALTPGPHAVAIRAWDGADNVGAASVTVKR